jgi:hypothetical protein
MAKGQSTAAWEYLVIPEAEREQLAMLGRDRWELVTIGGPPDEPLLYLKRSALEFRERITLDQRASYYAARGIEATPERSGEKAP